MMLATLVAGCNDSIDQVVVRPDLPPMAKACMKHPLPAWVEGKSIPVFALENRRVAILNALAVGDCQKFYEQVRLAYGARK